MGMGTSPNQRAGRRSCEDCYFMNEEGITKTENLLKGTAYVHKADPGQTVEFSKSKTRYVIQPNGALRRTVPKLTKAERRAAKNRKTKCTQD